MSVKPGKSSRDKELYRRLRQLSPDQLWSEEVARFDKATPEERAQGVAVVRAVGAAFASAGTAEKKQAVREWLRKLLHDPCEKIRRYAIAALPKLGAGAEEEADLLMLLRQSGDERERKVLTEALTKIGGRATLEQLARGAGGKPFELEQKVKAGLARKTAPSTLRLDRTLSDTSGVHLHLRTRKGLERIVREEVEKRGGGKFRVTGVHDGLVTITVGATFTLGDIYALRCFTSVGFVLGTVDDSLSARLSDDLASVITSPLTRRILETFTEGSIRYRLDFVSKGHQRGTVRQTAARAFALSPDILNDSRNAPWVIAIRRARPGTVVELTPRPSLDPRFHYRRADVPAASHPPLAACMARFAGPTRKDIVWDPFCGSGLELIECALLGGLHTVYGTDRDAEAIRIAEENFAAAELSGVAPHFNCGDFRQTATSAPFGPNSVTLILTNPPMGRRVPVADLAGLIGDLFSVAAAVLRPGGRLVLANPLRQDIPQPYLRWEAEHLIDLGGFHCRLQKYVKRGN